ncbi:hypothetical protein KZZ52_54605 [Dactylosporangium sp. AC04546]|uniref:hypothetical protein n=1 Tax=Dactylosporangium sp. AC04546 TaxID=2862460 RepID=UPI001EE08A90|nr:hypothetical protein [Dactylosporangium sp. AC04546]WVK82873.1 hypothetical protein KZZ52_54605 [Dactylosporangium sp. AC04546]
MTDGLDVPDDYTGRRRADAYQSPRIAFVVVLIVVAVVVVGLRGLLTGAPETARFTSGEAAGPVVPTLNGLPAPVVPAGSASPAHASASASPAASASASPVVSPGPSDPVGSGAPPSSAAPSVPPASPSPGTTGTTPASRSFEAEAPGNGRPGMTVREVTGASGGRAVTGVGNGRVLSFAGVDAAPGAEVTVTIAYLSIDTRRCYFRAGHGDWHVVTFAPSGGWDRVATVTVTLRPGNGRNNTIEAGNTPGRWCPDLDRITVAPR